MKYEEITPAAVILGILLGSIMTMSFVYVGLKLGFTMGGSGIAAILGFIILRGLLKKGSIIENNINQTVASGINIASSGITFTLPAVFLLGLEFNPFTVAIAAIAGSFLGIAIIIPLRKQMIERDQLPFPSGTAVAALLKSPGEGKQKGIILFGGMALAIIASALIKGDILPATIPIGHWFGMPAYTQTAISLSLMNIAAGMLAGKGGLPFAIGGVVAYWFLNPLAVGLQLIPDSISTTKLTAYLYKTNLRPMGIGIMLGGAFMSVLLLGPFIIRMLKRVKKFFTNKQTAKNKTNIDEFKTSTLIIIIFCALMAIFVTSLSQKNITALQAATISLFSITWIIAAGFIVAECTGATDISPVSGLSLIGITIILSLSKGNILLSVILGVVICVAISQCADMMQDLKTGHLIGSIPKKQQLIQFSIAWIGPIIAIWILGKLWMQGGKPPGFGENSLACLNHSPNCLKAPQATALKVMIEAILSGKIPLEKYIGGAFVGMSLTVIPVSSLAVLIGLAMYLPFPITLGFGLGIIISISIQHVSKENVFDKKIIPLAAGLLIGESLFELFFALYKITGT